LLTYPIRSNVYVVYVSQGGRSSGAQPSESGVSRTSEAYDRVREVILDRLAAGTKAIGEAELTRELGMSRTPVREALARLETEGYIRPASGRGYLIVELTAQDMIDVYTVRAELEGLAAAEAAKRIGRVDLARLEDLYEEMSKARAAGRDAQLATLNSDFHATIAEVGGNTYLKSMLDNIRSVFDRFRPTALTVPGRRDTAHDEHGLMIEALRRRDGEAARKLARDHVHRALATRQGALRKETNSC
jgi:DNA-binding GntR family transcriptional regulator